MGFAQCSARYNVALSSSSSSSDSVLIVCLYIVDWLVKQILKRALTPPYGDDAKTKTKTTNARAL